MKKQVFLSFLLAIFFNATYGQESWGIKQMNCDEKTCIYKIYFQENLTKAQGEKLISLFPQKEGIIACQVDYVENTCLVTVEKDFPAHYLSHVVNYTGLHIRQHPGRDF